MPSRSRGRQCRIVLMVALVLLLATSCGRGRAEPTAYGTTTRESFTGGCEEALAPAGDGSTGDVVADPAQRRAACACVYEEVSGANGLPFARFQQINDELEETPGPLSDDLRRIVERCVDTETED